MAFLILDALEVIRTNLLTTNYFADVTVGEPKSAPEKAQLTAHIWMDAISNPTTTLDKTIQVYGINLRIMAGAFEEPTSLLETSLAEAVSKADESLFADFTLGGKVRAIDVAGIYGVSYRVDFGYTEIDGTIFRMASFTIPLIVDDLATVAA